MERILYQSNEHRGRKSKKAKMDHTNEESVNSVVKGGPADGLPNDGTGKLPTQPGGGIADSNRCRQARSVAFPFQRIPPTQIQKGTRLDYYPE